VKPGWLKAVKKMEAFPKPASMIQNRLEQNANMINSDEGIRGILEDAIAVGAKVLWMQLDVINEKAAARAFDAGLKVVG
jgi:predicted CoA-binding protein